MVPASVLNHPTPETEQRRFDRVPVALHGRYMLANRAEYVCEIIDMSPGGAQLVAPTAGVPGEHVIVYADHIGRLEGIVSRLTSNGFCILIDATPRKREKLANQLAWLTSQGLMGAGQDRRHIRHIPARPHLPIRFENGTEVPSRIIDISLSGAGIECPLRPNLGHIVQLARVRGRVVRHFENGFAIEFSTLQTPETFAELARLIGAPIALEH